MKTDGCTIKNFGRATKSKQIQSRVTDVVQSLTISVEIHIKHKAMREGPNAKEP